MKEIYMLAGFAAGVIGGVVVGTMLYKHCGDTKKMVDEAEKCIAKEVDMLGDSIQKKAKKVSKKIQEPAQ